MKIFHKNVTIGDYKFGISVDRDIVADSFEKFPDLMEVLLSYSSPNGEVDGNAVMLKAIKDKKLKAVLESEEQIAELVKYAFPRMLEKADAFDGTKNAKKADEIINFVYENDAEDDFNSEMFKFVCLGFTPETTEKKKPKVKIVIK